MWKLGGHLRRDPDLLQWELPGLASEADGSDELAAGDHRHHHVHGGRDPGSRSRAPELTQRSARTRSRHRFRALQRGRVAALPRYYWVGVLPGERDAPLGLCSSTAITSMDLARFRPSRTS